MKQVCQLSLSLLFATCTSWSATVLNFEGIAPYPNANDVLIQNFYNGGTASNGSVGPNFGVTFDAPALLLCLNTLGTGCSNASRGGVGDPSSAQGGLFFLTSNSVTMNVTGGFGTGFSLNYSGINQAGSVSIFDAANGGGNLLGTFALPVTTSSCAAGFAAPFCPFVSAGIAFAGTAQSVVFAGVGSQTVLDDISFGSNASANEVPEPATVGLVGITLGALVIRRLRNS